MCFSCICLFVLYVLVFVIFLFLLVSGIGCGLWLWHSLVFSVNLFFLFYLYLKPCRSLSTTFDDNLEIMHISFEYVFILVDTIDRSIVSI